MKVLHAFHGAHVLGAFEGAGIGAFELAHAAAHLRNRFIFVLFHPVAEFALNVTQVVDTMSHKRRAHHGDVGADHQQLDDVLGAMHSAGGGELRLHVAVQNSDPGERQAQCLRGAQQHIRANFQFLEINVGLVEAVEQDQSIGAGVVKTVRHVGHVAEERAQLNRDWNRDGGLYRLHNVDVSVLDVGCG